jgi:hypothetical protein
MKNPARFPGRAQIASFYFPMHRSGDSSQAISYGVDA